MDAPAAAMGSESAGYLVAPGIPVPPGTDDRPDTAFMGMVGVGAGAGFLIAFTGKGSG